MIKKAFTALAVAGALVFAGSAAANAYPVAPPPVVGDSTLAPGVPTTITVTGLEAYDEVVFSVPGGATLSSIVYASTSVSAVTKPVTNGSASAQFVSNVPGTFVISISDTSGNLITSVTLAVDGSFADPAPAGVVGGVDSASGVGALPATGGEAPLAAIWLGVGALGIGGIAVVAAVARRRSQSTR